MAVEMAKLSLWLVTVDASRPFTFLDHAFKSGDLNFGDNLPVLMTEKDAVKCAAFADERCWYVPVTAEFAESEAAALIDLVLARIKAFKTGN